MINLITKLFIVIYLLFGQIVHGQGPGNLSGLTLWLNADSGIVLNGTKVSQWLDESGSNFSSGQTDAQAQPELLQNSLNGHNEIRFDGSDILNGVVIPSINSSSITLFIVASGFSMGNSYSVLFDIAPFSPGGLWLTKYTDTYTLYHNNWNLSTSSGDLPNQGFPSKIFGLVKDFNNKSELYLNGQFMISSTTSQLTGNFTNGTYNVGGDPSWGGMWNGDVAEIILYNRVLDSLERTSVERYLFNKYAPPVDLGNDLSLNIFCDYNLTTNGSYRKYLWSTGDTTESISISNSGEYSVSVTDGFGNSSSDTVYIQINHPVPFVITDSVSCGFPVNWNTGIDKQNFQFLWSNSSTDSSLTISQSGQYFVTITDSLGCTFQSDTVIVTIDNFPTAASLGPDTSFCAGNALYLKQGIQPGISYLWNDGSVNDSLYVSNPGQYWVQLTNSNDCVAYDTINVVINGIAAQVNFNGLQGCEGLPVSFSDSSVPPVGASIVSWQWDFGDILSADNSSVISNPQHIFSDTGIYSVKLSVETDQGCISSQSQSVHIFPKPFSDFTNLNSCENAVTQLLSNSLDFGYPINQWQWDFGDPGSGTLNSSNLENPVHVFNNDTLYNIQLIIQNIHGCRDTVEKNLLVKTTPEVDFTFSNACEGQVVSFSDDSSIPFPQWVLESGYNINGTQFNGLNVSSAFPSPGSYQVEHYLKTSNGCSDTIVKSLIIYEKPDAGFTHSLPCTNNGVIFSDTTKGEITQWLWTFPEDEYIDSSITHSFSFPGTYPVSLLVTDSNNCTDSIIKQITVHPSPEASFTVSDLYSSIGVPVQFLNTSIGATTFSWSFDDGSSSQLTSPIHLYNDSGYYNPVLISFNDFGCSDTFSITVQIVKAFTDLAVSALNGELHDGFFRMYAQFINLGSTDITSFNYIIEAGGEQKIKDTWTGILAHSNGILNLDLPSEISINKEDYVCLLVVNVNDSIDDVLTNNKLCTPISNGFKVMPVFPNPASDVIYIPVISPENSFLEIEITDAKGAFVKYDRQTLFKGLQFLSMDISSLSKGFYLIKATSGTFTSNFQFIKY